MIESLPDTCARADQSVREVERTALAQLSGRDSITRQLAAPHPLNGSSGIPYCACAVRSTSPTLWSALRCCQAETRSRVNSLPCIRLTVVPLTLTLDIHPEIQGCNRPDGLTGYSKDGSNRKCEEQNDILLAGREEMRGVWSAESPPHLSPSQWKWFCSSSHFRFGPSLEYPIPDPGWPVMYVCDISKLSKLFTDFI